MAHVIPPAGSRLRLRLYPRPNIDKLRRRRAAPTSLALFDTPPDDSNDSAAERLAARVVNFCLMNRNNSIILDRFPELGLRDWWLTSDCLFQTVWNLKIGRRADHAILNYEIFYFSEDPSWDAENEVIHNAKKLFEDLPVKVQVRNQARVHLWFPEKFGIGYPPLTTAGEGILRFPASSQMVGIKRTGNDFIDIYAPFGLGDLWEMVVRPNRALPLSDQYEEKTTNWHSRWPTLNVYSWSGRTK